MPLRVSDVGLLLPDTGRCEARPHPSPCTEGRAPQHIYPASLGFLTRSSRAGRFPSKRTSIPALNFFLTWNKHTFRERCNNSTERSRVPSPRFPSGDMYNTTEKSGNRLWYILRPHSGSTRLADTCLCACTHSPCKFTTCGFTSPPSQSRYGTGPSPQGPSCYHFIATVMSPRTPHPVPNTQQSLLCSPSL